MQLEMYDDIILVELVIKHTPPFFPYVKKCNENNNIIITTYKKGKIINGIFIHTHKKKKKKHKKKKKKKKKKNKR
jgi:hypothetical protein